MTRSSIIGAISGAIILGALWAFAGRFVHDIGLAGASLFKWLGGSVAESDPLIAYRWGGVGLVGGGVLGGIVGGVCKNIESRVGGVLIGALASVAGLVLSAIIVVLTTGGELSSELVSAPALIGVVGTISAGSLIGGAIQMALQSLGLLKKV